MNNLINLGLKVNILVILSSKILDVRSKFVKIRQRYSTLAKFMKKILLPTEMLLKTEN